MLKLVKSLLNNPVGFAKQLRATASRLLRPDISHDEVTRWFRDKGDENLRLDYPDLDESSIVFDIGGFEGNFAHAINEKYGCKVYAFEPHPRFYEISVARFSSNDKVVPLNYGLSDTNGVFTLSDSADGSSFLNPNSVDEERIECEVRDILNVLEELEISEIDLVKINIEGGEYPLLLHMASQSALALVKEYQIQFHDFIDDAESMRDEITAALSETHEQTWCYTFVWENWKRRTSVA